MEIYIPDWIVYSLLSFVLALFIFVLGMATAVYCSGPKWWIQRMWKEGDEDEFLWYCKLQPFDPEFSAKECDNDTYSSLEGLKILLEGAGLQSYEGKFASIGIKSIEDLHQQDVQEIMGKVGLTPSQIWKLAISDGHSLPEFLKAAGNTHQFVDNGHISWILLYRDAYTARHLDYKKVEDYGAGDIKDVSSPDNVPYWLKNYKAKNQ